jgi:hypothetical protein
MPMQAESLEVLEKASVAPAQARAFVRAIEIEIAGAKDTLATKHDVLLLRQDLETLRTELRGEMSTLEAVLRGEMTKLEARLQAQIAELAATLRAEIAKQGTELRTEIAGVTRHMYTAILGQMAVLLGFAYFFATHLR